MQAIVKNFRGVVEAQISISQIALIAGLNGSGKTSIARAVAAAATGKPIPYAKVTKKDCGILLRQGTKAAMAAIGSNDAGSTQIEWPKAEAHSVGTPPTASDIAAGVTDLFTMTPKDALAYMIDLLKAAPTLGDIKQAFDQAGFADAEKIATAVCRAVEEKGWDGAHAQAKEKGQQLKGAWSHVTGTAYGKKKADEWYPEGWEDDMLKEDFEAVLTNLRHQLEAAIGKSAVNKAERERLQQLVDEIPALEEQVSPAIAAVNSAENALSGVISQLQKNPNPDAKTEYACPHCEGLVHITATSGSAYMLTKAAKVDKEQLKQARLMHAGLCGEKTKLEQELNAAKYDKQQLVQKLDAAAAAKSRLLSLTDPIVKDNTGELTTLRTQIAETEKRQQMVSKFREATKLAAQIGTNQAIIDALDETGIRKTKLAQCLDAFAATYVEPLCKDFGIPSVLIDADLSVMMGDVSYPMLSASEQFRVRTVLQLAIAVLEQAALVIIDGADILDKPGRTRLLNMVVNAKMPAIICMTLNKPDLAPNLATAGVGITYWIEKGICRPLIAAGERAAA